MRPRDFLRGLLLPLRGGRLILATPGAWRWAVAPFLCNLLLYALFFAAMVWLLKSFGGFRFDWAFWGDWGARLGEWTAAGGRALLWLVAVPVFFFCGYFTFFFCGAVLAAPFNDALSEKLEIALTGRPAPAWAWRGAWLSFRLSMGSTLRLLARQLFWMAATLPLLLVPLVGQAAWFLLSAYFTGLAYLDFAMARNFLGHRAKLAAARENRAAVTGLGAALLLLFAVPFLGVLLLPLGAAGATILYCSLDWRGILARAGLPPPEGFCFPLEAPGGKGAATATPEAPTP